MSLKRWLITGLSFALTLGISLYIVITRWPKGGTPFLPWPAHALALSAVLLEITTRAYKIVLSARALNIRVSFLTAVRVSLGGDFAAAITPARTGAEPARYLVLAEAGLGGPQRLLVLFAEMFLEMLSLMLVAGLLAAFFHASRGALAGLLGLVGGYSTFVLGVGATGLLLARNNASGPPPAWAARIGLHAGRWRVIQRQLRQLRASLSAVREAHLGSLVLAFTGSVMHVLLRASVLPLLVYGSMPDLPLTRQALGPLMMWPLSLYYGGVVVPAPGGGGAIEAAFTAVLSSVIPMSIFAACLLWWRFYTFYFYIIVGGLSAGGTVMRALRDEDEEDEADESGGPTTRISEPAVK